MNGQPIKVVHVINTLQIGGAENCVRLLVSHLDRRRFSPIVVAVQGSGPYEKELSQEGITVKVMNRPRRSIILWPVFVWDVLITGWQLYHFLKKEKPLILQTHLPVSEYFGLLIGRWAGIPHLIYTFHSSNFLPKRSRKSLRFWARKKLTQILSGRVQRVVAVSKAIAEKVRENLPAPTVAVQIIPNGIEVARFQNVIPQGTLKKELGMDPGDPLITSIGSLSPVKNQIMLLSAAARMIRIYPKMRLILVGEGPLKKSLLDFRERLGLVPYVHFLGLRKDIPEILSETDIFVSTSRWEGLPLSILEAMAAGKPIVATAVPGVLEVLEENTGILIPLDDIDELTRALQTLIENPTGRLELGQKGRERVKAYYALEAYVHQWEALYEELLFGEPSCPIK